MAYTLKNIGKEAINGSCATRWRWWTCDGHKKIGRAGVAGPDGRHSSVRFNLLFPPLSISHELRKGRNCIQIRANRYRIVPKVSEQRATCATATNATIVTMPTKTAADDFSGTVKDGSRLRRSDAGQGRTTMCWSPRPLNVYYGVGFMPTTGAGPSRSVTGTAG